MAKSRCGIAAFALLLGSFAVAEDFKIGTQGAVLSTDATWQRKKLNPSLGPDQFLSSAGLFAFVMEHQGVFEQRADFETLLGTVLSGIRTRLTDFQEESAFKYELREGIGRASQSFTGTAEGIHLAYRLDMIARDGLGYLVMTWSDASQSQTAQQQGGGFAQGLRFPPPESEWGKQSLATTHSFQFDDWKIDLTYRSSLFKTTMEKEGTRGTLKSLDDTVSVYMFLNRFKGEVNEALDNVITPILEDDGLEEVGRWEVEQPIGKGREALLRKTGDEGGYDVALAVIKLEDGVYADLRMVSSHPGGHREKMWEAMLNSLRATAPRKVDAFPVVEVSDVQADPALTPAAKDLLKSCQQIAPIGWAAKFHTALDGTIIAVESQRVVSISPQGGAVRVLYSDENWLGFKSPVLLGDEVLVVDGDEQVQRLRSEELEEAGFSAKFIAETKDGLILARVEPASSVLGINSLPNLHPTKFLFRGADGNEKTITELAGFIVQEMAVNRDATSMAIATMKNDPLKDEEDPAVGRVNLIEVSIPKGIRRDLCSWLEIDQLVVGDGGWLVTGKPTDGMPGLYLVRSTGESELLISGSIKGISLVGDTLTFATPVCLETTTADSGHCIYRGPMESVRTHGRKFSVFTAQLLNAVVTELGARSTPFASAEEISEYVRAASAKCEAKTGVPLPSTNAGVDNLIGNFASDSDLSDGSQILLSALLTRQLLGQGGIWINSPTGSIAGSLNGDGWESGTVLAVAVRPLQVVISTLYQEESWTEPVSSLLSRARGRKILLGENREALVKAMKEQELTEGEKNLGEAKPQQFADLLLKYPNNEYLREKVYRWLFAAGQMERAAQLAGLMVKGRIPTAIDRQAWLAARLSLSPNPKELDGLIADLKDAITHDPKATSLYLVLGAAYEKMTVPDRNDYARACYRKVTQLTSWGEDVRTAKAAIARIDAKK